MNETLRRAIDARDLSVATRDFLDVVEELGRDSDRQRSPEGRQFLTETAPLVSDAQPVLENYLWDAAVLARSEFYGDQWYVLCVRRSRIEYVRDLYRDLVSVDWNVSFLDTEDLDMVLRNVGKQEGGVRPERIPSGTPRSHWWWWYPEDE